MNKKMKRVTTLLVSLLLIGGIVTAFVFTWAPKAKAITSQDAGKYTWKVVVHSDNDTGGWNSTHLMTVYGKNNNGRDSETSIGTHNQSMEFTGDQTWFETTTDAFPTKITYAYSFGGGITHRKMDAHIYLYVKNGNNWEQTGYAQCYSYEWGTNSGTKTLTVANDKYPTPSVSISGASTVYMLGETETETYSLSSVKDQYDVNWGFSSVEWSDNHSAFSINNNGVATIGYNGGVPYDVTLTPTLKKQGYNDVSPTGTTVRVNPCVNLSLNTEETVNHINGSERWYQFTPATTGNYIFFTYDSDNTPDPKLWLYEPLSAMDTLGTQKAYNDDIGDAKIRELLAGSQDNYGSWQSWIKQELTAGNTYILRAYANGSSGTYPMKVCKAVDVTFKPTGGGTEFTKTLPAGHTLHMDQTGFSRSGHTLKAWSLQGHHHAPKEFLTSDSRTVPDSDTTYWALWTPNSGTATELTLNGDHTTNIDVGGKINYFTFTPTETRDYIIYSTSTSTGNADPFVILYVASTYRNSAALKSYNDDGRASNSAFAEGNDSNERNFLLKTTLTQDVEYLFGVKCCHDGVYNVQSGSNSGLGDIPFRFEEVYSVTYDANSGSGAPGEQTKYYNKTLTLSSTKPTRTGYDFVKWNTKADGSGADYTSGGNYTANADATLYAQWTKQDYKITYSATGATIPGTAGTSYTTNYTITDAVTLPGAATGKTGYQFSKWRASRTDSNDGKDYNWGTSDYNKNATFAAGNKYGSVTLTATWTENTGTLHFNNNGVTPASNASNMAITYGSNSGNLPTLAKSGWEFLGWATAADGAAAQNLTAAMWGGGTAIPAATLNPWIDTDAEHGSTIELYAVWRKAFTATFEDMNGSNKRIRSDITGYVYNGSDSTTPQVTAPTQGSYSGWNTAGWRNDSTAGASNTTTFYAGSTYYGVYSRQISATYADGGHGTVPSTAPTAQTQYANASDISVHSSVTFTLEAMSNVTGYTFEGWNVGSTEYDKTSATLTPTSTTVTFTGRWSINHYALTYASADTNKGTVSGSVTSGTQVNYNTASYIQASPETGHHFVNWTYAANKAPDAYTNSTSASSKKAQFNMPDHEVNATANFAVNTGTITYNKNGVNATMPDSTTITYGSTATAGKPSGIPTGWEFLGWATSADTTSATFANATTITIPTTDAINTWLDAEEEDGNTVTLYAVWRKGFDATFVDMNGTAQRTQTVTGYVYNGSAETTPAVTAPTQGTYTNWEAAGWTTGTGATAGTTSSFAAGTTYYGKYSRTISASYQDGGHGTLPAAPASQTQYANASDIGARSNVTFTLGSMADVEGWTFLGWESGGVNYEKNGTATLTPDLSTTSYVFTGRWSKNSHPLTYAVADGQTAMGSVSGSVTSGSDVGYQTASWIKAAKNPGYHFVNWTFASGKALASGDYTNGTTANSEEVKFNMPDRAVTATANFAVNTGTLTFNYNGVTPAANANDIGISYGSASSALPALTNGSGWVLQGWTTAASASAAQSVMEPMWGSGSAIPVATINGWLDTVEEHGRTITLYAVWRKEFKATFVDMDGTAQRSQEVSAFVYNGDTNTTPAVTAPAQGGYTGDANWTAAGWRNDTSAAAANTATFNAGSTYYGVYSRNITATYNANGHGTAPAAPAAQTQYTNANAITTRSDVTFPLTAMSNVTGYTFTGWLVDSATGSTYYNTNVTLTPAANKTSYTFYAKWTANTTTVTLDSDWYANGTAADSEPADEPGDTSVTATYAAAMPNLTVLPQTTGYTFGGYWSGKTGTGKQYYDASGHSANNWDVDAATATLYAEWTAKTYKITYLPGEADENSQGIESSAIAYDADATIGGLPNGWTYTGHSFVGWADENANTYVEGNTFNMK
ncbi:MAG: InlB B-repeat-containing protein, partial [Clostridia bacterium]|nr:InlB B-repeat-containing protein [Clostridia bacterium]